MHFVLHLLPNQWVGMTKPQVNYQAAKAAYVPPTAEGEPPAVEAGPIGGMEIHSWRAGSWLYYVIFKDCYGTQIAELDGAFIYCTFLSKFCWERLSPTTYFFGKALGHQLVKLIPTLVLKGKLLGCCSCCWHILFHAC